LRPTQQRFITKEVQDKDEAPPPQDVQALFERGSVITAGGENGKTLQELFERGSQQNGGNLGRDDLQRLYERGSEAVGAQ
jgi:hypothetical protein